MKKGNESGEGLEQIVYMIMVMVILIIGLYILFYAVSNMDFYVKVQDSALTYNILSSRYIYSSDCLAYEDERGHVYPGVIDSTKWGEDSAYIRDCISGENDIKVYLELESYKDKFTYGEKSNVNADTFFVTYYDINADKKYPATLYVQLKGYDSYDEEIEDA